MRVREREREREREKEKEKEKEKEIERKRERERERCPTSRLPASLTPAKGDTCAPAVRDDSLVVTNSTIFKNNNKMRALTLRLPKGTHVCNVVRDNR